MSTYDKAYCRSLDNSGKYISAEEANEFTLKKIISKNEKLYCSENCPLILTCINRDVDFSKHPNKIRPYYANRIRNQHHSNDCDRKKEFVDNHKNKKVKYHFYHFTDDNKKLIFDFDLINGLTPNKASTMSNTSVSQNPGKSRKVNGYKNTSTSKLNLNNRTHHTRLLKAIVDLWEAYQEYGLQQELYDKNNKPISWNDLFVRIQGASLNNSVYRIYYGQAFCKPIKEIDNNGEEVISQNEVILSFAGEKATLDQISNKPNVILHRAQFEKHRAKHLFDKFVTYAKAWNEDTTDSSSYFTLYYLGKFRKVTSKKQNKTYISLDYTDPNFTHNMVITPNQKF